MNKGELSLTSGTHPKTVEILGIEDNFADIRLIREFLVTRHPNCRLTFVHTGKEGLEYLHRRGRFTDARRPHLVILDLNLPAMSGFEVLHRIKSDPELTEIPVIILTGSSSKLDIEHAYEQHANCYFIKPPLLDDFTDLLRRIEETWVEAASLPNRAEQVQS